MNIEQLTADTILQKPVKCKIGDKTLMVERPTVGTLIDVSRLVGTLPEVEAPDQEHIFEYTLANCENYAVVGEILALLILGRKGRQPAFRAKLSWIPDWLYYKIFKKDMVKVLAERILDTMSCEDMAEAFISLINLHNVGFFLRITTSLREANLLKRTKKEGE